MMVYGVQHHINSSLDDGGGLIPLIASLVSLGTVVLICSWCLCWKKSKSKDSDSEFSYSSTESLTSPSTKLKYRSTVAIKGISPGVRTQYTSVSSESSPYGSPQASPGLKRKATKFVYPPPPAPGYEIQSPQPDVGAIELPPEPPVPAATSKEFLGKLYFSISYDSNHMVLTIKILKATSLPAKDFSGTSDPFVKILLLPDKKHKLETRVKRKNLNPVWNEVFTFEGFPHNKLIARSLYLEVLDYDRFSRNDPIGQIEIPLADVDLGPMALTFCKELHPCKRGQELLGDLLISLMYQPSNNRIVVVVMKGARIKAMDITGTSDPYVKIYVMMGGKRTEKKKTTIKKRTRDPVWNESFIFNVPVEKLRDMTFVFSVMDFDRITSNETIGQVILGYRTTGSSLRHWTGMMNNPRKPVAQWHRLQLY